MSDWDDLYEQRRLEVECQVLAAEAAALSAERQDIETVYMCKRWPDDPTMRTIADNARRIVAYESALTPEPDWEPRFAGLYIERTVYEWRRDYGEWPSRYNLADRLSVTTGLSRRQAEKRILATINAADDGYGVHCVRSARLDEILAGEDRGVGPWQRSGEQHLRFYLLAESQPRHASAYRDAYIAEAVA